LADHRREVEQPFGEKRRPEMDRRCARRIEHGFTVTAGSGRPLSRSRIHRLGKVFRERSADAPSDRCFARARALGAPTRPRRGTWDSAGCGSCCRRSLYGRSPGSVPHAHQGLRSRPSSWWRFGTGAESDECVGAGGSLEAGHAADGIWRGSATPAAATSSAIASTCI
jgi:hypothetical protein